MSARLGAAERPRRNFLADVTPELRTPLTVVRGNVEGMLDGVYAPDQARLGATLDEIRLLGALIEDLRTLALADTGSLTLQRESTDLTELVRETAAQFHERAIAAGITLAVEAPDELTAEIDPVRIRQVIENLI